MTMPLLLAQALLLLTPIGRESPDYQPQEPTPLVVTYIANEGFLVSVGEDSFLVDALHENPWGYTSTPVEVRAMLSTHEAPFQGIDLLVASHPHADHFSPGLVHSYLQGNPDVLFAGSTATMTLLRDSVGGALQENSAQLREVNPPWGESETLSFGEDSEVRFLTLNHQTEERDPSLTLATLAKMGGRTVLHLADLFPPTSVGYLEGYGLEEEEIDILFADPWFVISEEGSRLIREVLRPGTLVLMHLRPAEWEEQKEEVLALWPDAVVFGDPLERRVF